MPFKKAENEIESSKTGNHSRFSVVFIVLLILLAVAIGLYMGEYAKFNPINGTFQNYNPVRRLLDGQIPYKEFQDYLGFGHLYLGTAATLIAGGTYRGSLIAFTVLTFFSTAAIFLVLGRCIAGKKHMVCFTAMCVMLLLAWQIVEKVYPAFPGNAPAAFSVGNSARMLRASVLPVTAGFFLAIKDLSWRAKIVLCALISAAAFLWCNDYGISCWICIALMLFVVMLSGRTGLFKTLLCVALELMLSAVFIFILVELFTLGHFSDWFKSTFGTGGYQSWYYNSLKSHYLYDLDYSIAVIIQTAFCIYYLIRLIREHGSGKAIIRYGIPAYFNMVCICAANEYKLLSGGYLWEASEIVLGTTVLGEAFALLSGISGRKGKPFFKYAYTVLKSLLATAIAVTAAAFIIVGTGEKQGTYIPQLGGYNVELGEDLLKASAFIDGRSFFAAYSSAQEVVEDKFQPSGTDYIIHVLGDEQREEYLRAFGESNPELASTINEEYSYYEYWVQRANWFFYRELYAYWHPAYANAYEMYWEKNDRPEDSAFVDNASVEVEVVSPAIKKLIIHAEPGVFGTADVFVDWSVSSRKSLRTALLFNPMVFVQNTGSVFACYPGGGPMAYFDSNWLRAESAEFIPVTVADGYGEVVLSSMPEEDTELRIREVSCNRILTVQFDYLHVSDIDVSEDGKVVLSVVNTLRNAKIAENADQIELNGERFEVEKVEKDSMLKLTVSSEDIGLISGLLEKKNMVFCIKGPDHE